MPTKRVRSCPKREQEEVRPELVASDVDRKLKMRFVLTVLLVVLSAAVIFFAPKATNLAAALLGAITGYWLRERG